MEKLRVKCLSAHAIVPKRATPGSVGYDLRAAQDCEIEPLGKTVVPLDLCFAIPKGCYGRIAPRSSLAAKHHIDVGAGVVDTDYRGPVSAVLFNLSPTTAYTVKRGDAVAQLILEHAATPEVEEVKEFSPGEAGTERGEGGFGSTGK